MKLYLFTASFPNGIYEQWKAGEIKLLSEKFASVHIVPFSYFDDFTTLHDLGNNVTVHGPLIQSPIHLKPGHLLNLFSRRVFKYMAEFFSARVFRSKKRFIAFMNTVSSVEAMMRIPIIKQLLEAKVTGDTVLYFYWGVGGSALVPFLKRFKNTIVRFHGFDLYIERNHGYIPFRKQLVRSMKVGGFISQHGMSYMTQQFPDYSSKFRLFRIGTPYHGISHQSTDSVFRIISCSSVTGLKRVPLMAEAISLLQFPVEWTHLGQGEEFEQTETIAANFYDHIKVNLPGHVESNMVSSYYVEEPVDVFLNVSTTEGVPVSIMEALAAGIPVMATKVGGTPEIIDNTVGVLLEPELTAEQLADELTAFRNRSYEEKEELRQNCFKRFKERCNSAELNKRFVQFLINLNEQ